MNTSEDKIFGKAGKWTAEFGRLRQVALDCGLDEELKWGFPCYTSGGKNIVLIHGFRDYCALLFFKGALLQDAAGLLVRQSENVQAARQARFTGVKEIGEQEALLKAYIHEAVAVEKAGLKVHFKPPAAPKSPEEFQEMLNANPALRNAFEALTPGRQRAYLLYFSAPVQSKTRASRVEKCLPQILSGKGLND